jgi:hypothetical protein
VNLWSPRAGSFEYVEIAGSNDAWYFRVVASSDAGERISSVVCGAPPGAEPC